MMADRDLTLASRKVETREKRNIEIFDIEEIEAHFNDNIELIKSQFKIAEELIINGKESEAAEIWRSQIVFLDSAFDFYLHEVVKLGIICVFHGDWEKTDKYNNLLLKMSNVEEAIHDTEDDAWLKQWINKKYASETFMSFSAFKDICNLLNIDYRIIADAVFYIDGGTVKTVDQIKNRIDGLFTRRNQIAHQMDRLHENAERLKIEQADVEMYICDIVNIVNAVGEEIRKK